MTDREAENLAATKRLYEVCAAGQWDAVSDMLTDDFVASEAPGLPYEGKYCGREGLRTLYEKVMGMMDVTGLEIHQMTVGGDWVMVLLDMIVRDKDGSDLRIPLAEGSRFRDGQVCEVRPYYFDAALPARGVAAKRAAETVSS